MSEIELAGWLSRANEALRDDADYLAEKLAIRFTESITELMLEKAISRAALADAMDVSRAYVTKILNAPPNLTLRSMVNVATALDASVDIQVTRREVRPSLAATSADGFQAVGELHATWNAADAVMERAKILPFPPRLAAASSPSAVTVAG